MKQAFLLYSCAFTSSGQVIYRWKVIWSCVILLPPQQLLGAAGAGAELCPPAPGQMRDFAAGR